MTAAPAPVVDRQERLRSRIDDLAQQLVSLEDTHAEAEKLAGAAERKLTDQRRQLRSAEDVHERAVTRLAAATSERDVLAAELASLTRRLQMATLVREARS